tara:strand:+ start:1102 stop:2763 length:1662 start_codon:yes stop_codon:yes gene_type:complete
MTYVGGYYMIKEPFLKAGVWDHTASLRRPVSDHILYVCDALGKTPLMINEFILDVVTELIERNETLGGIPPSDMLPLPPMVPDHEWESLTKNERMQVKADRERVYSQNAKFTGQREAMFRKAKLATELRDQTFWIPHCPDFRGRLYPQSQDLNFTNDDLARGLIQFAETQPLTERGVYWMAVRLANNFGLDKLSFDQRVQWVVDNDELIIDSGANPLDGQRFWNQADDPFQFLAACREYHRWAEARAEGREIDSHLVVNVDATASGLQHLSAWSRDPVAAEVVNMTGRHERYDIYTIQADALNRLIVRDRETVEEARNCHGFVDRKTVKRGIMTIPYSVTPQGLRDQFISDGHVDHIPGSRIRNANYLRDSLLESLGDTIRKPMEVMTYFKGVAGALADANIPLQFRTPMGMTIRQAYWRLNKKEVRTLFGKATLWYSEESMGLKRNKQMLAASPNIIHSYDAAHLQAVVLVGSTQKNPITSWACIHDSVGVHASEVDRLNKVIREEFVRIYDRPVLEEFHDNQLRHKVSLPSPPQLGAFNLSEVLDAPYFFS